MTSRKPIVHAAINHESHPPTLDWRLAGRYDKQATSTRQLRGIAVPSRGAARPSCECRHATRKLEGAGNAGCTMHPQPCVQRVKAHKRSHHRYAETFRHSPRDGFTVSFVTLPGDRALLPPSPGGFVFHRLDPSVGGSGPHDFAVRFEKAPVLRTQSVHRIPRSTFVTTRNAPPDERGTAMALLLFLPNEKAKYFSPQDWTRRANQCRQS